MCCSGLPAKLAASHTPATDASSLETVESDAFCVPLSQLELDHIPILNAAVNALFETREKGYYSTSLREGKLYLSFFLIKFLVYLIRT